MNGSVQIYYGEGRGKSPAALGNALRAADTGQSVIFIQFLKGKQDEENILRERLEPEIKFFSFEKIAEYFSDLSDEEKKEESMNMKNGMNYARKVLTTNECDLLVLDEVLGLVDNGIVTVEELKALVASKPQDMELILTGRVLPQEIAEIADEIYHIVAENK